MNIDTKFLCSIYRSAPTHFGAVDMLNKELIFSSGMAEKTLGYTKEEAEMFLKNDFVDIVHPEDIEKSKTLFEALENSKEGEIIRSIIRVKASNGKYLHFQINDTVYERDKEGKPMKFSTVIQDVTSEALLRDKLEEALQVIKKIRYRNSHELRGPVAAIMGIVNLIDENTFQNSYQHELFLYLGTTIKQLDSIIREINEETT